MITIATTLEEARRAEGEYRAGGTDVQARRRYRVSSGPIADISRIPGLDAIAWDGDKVTIGAHVKLDTISRDQSMIAKYPGFAMGAGALATPQIRWMASLGGSLLQRTRCAYYRHPDITCFKKGGDSCPSRDGDHRLGVCFDRGPCVFPHPSTLGMVLMAYEAEVQTHGASTRSIEDIYGDGADPSRDHLLASDEILTHVVLDSVWQDERASYFRSISRARAEWPLVEVIARLEIDAQDTIQKARVAIGGVATVPFRLPHVEEALVGRAASEQTFTEASKLASQGANPLPQTEYKVELVERTVLETLQRAYHRVWGGEG